MDTKEKTNQEIVEEAVGTMYMAFYRMRQAGEHQEEYDTMETIINMLQQDRQHMREKFNVK